MKITPQTKIIDIIRLHPEVIEVLASYNSRFELLKNPIMRKTFARVATVKHASKVAGVNLTELVKLLNNAIGERISDEDIVDREGNNDEISTPIKDIVQQGGVKTVHLDVRDIMKKGEEPFNIIMQTVAKMNQGEALVLETIFEPVPLYDVLKKRGFIHQTETLGEDHYKIWFYRIDKKKAGKKMDDNITSRIREDGNIVYLDVRGLEPPEPMAMILDTIARLDSSKTLVVQHERVPMFLYPKLEERGYSCETHQVDESNVQLVIRPKNITHL
jgi:uncharacterized protein (DUF2249 family)